MTWKSGGVLVLLLLLSWAGVAASVDAVPGRAYWQAKYQRPAEIPVPEDNPYSAAKAELGKALFFDPILSGSGTRSCASCHNPGLSWSDGLPRAIGEGQKPLALRTPTLIAAAHQPRLGWDGKFSDIEAVAFGPITSPSNMNLSEAELIDRLSAIQGYVDAFDAAFGSREIARRQIELALAVFQRTIDPGETAFDRWIAG